MVSLICIKLILGVGSNGNYCMVYSVNLLGGIIFSFCDFNFSGGFWLFGKYYRIDFVKYRAKKLESDK
jgi:hypothetical protein